MQEYGTASDLSDSRGPTTHRDWQQYGDNNKRLPCSNFVYDPVSGYSHALDWIRYSAVLQPRFRRCFSQPLFRVQWARSLPRPIFSSR
ncbi:Cocaine esterase [Fusarium oxysporum f. sp. albedinis]|nr:Cocaine esterase [Fusarium oxysporum f. sp. albedinis]